VSPVQRFQERRDVEAIRYDGTNHEEIVAFARGAIEWLPAPRSVLRFKGGTQIITGEWVVREPRGGLQMMFPQIFESIYEPVAGPAAQPEDERV